MYIYTLIYGHKLILFRNMYEGCSQVISMSVSPVSNFTEFANETQTQAERDGIIDEFINVN